MAYITSQLTNTGSFVTTTNVWDVQQIQEVDVRSPEFKELLVRLYQTVNNIALSLNGKDSALYTTYEFVTGQIYSFNGINDQRPGYRTMVNTGHIGAGTTSINHNLAVTSSWTWISLDGMLTNQTTLVGYPIDYANPSAAIYAHVTSTQVVINNSSGVTFTNGVVVLEYIKT
jgi:hypothetical protein